MLMRELLEEFREFRDRLRFLRRMQAEAVLLCTQHEGLAGRRHPQMTQVLEAVRKGRERHGSSRRALALSAALR